MHLVIRLRGGGPGRPKEELEMGIAPGGLIKQCILSDNYPPSIWEPERGIGFNVQVLNSELFRQVTDMDPPDTPITAATYAEQGLPFFEIYDETSTIKGDFAGVNSVKAIDKAKAKAAGKRGSEVHDEPPIKNPIVLLNPDGGSITFRPVSELEKELASMKAE